MGGGVRQIYQGASAGRLRTLQNSGHKDHCCERWLSRRHATLCSTGLTPAHAKECTRFVFVVRAQSRWLDRMPICFALNGLEERALRAPVVATKPIHITKTRVNSYFSGRSAQLGIVVGYCYRQSIYVRFDGSPALNTRYECGWAMLLD